MFIRLLPILMLICLLGGCATPMGSPCSNNGCGSCYYDVLQCQTCNTRYCNGMYTCPPCNNYHECIDRVDKSGCLRRC